MAAVSKGKLASIVRSTEHAHILAALVVCGGDKFQTARRLGISTTTLRRKMALYQITTSCPTTK